MEAEVQQGQQSPEGQLEKRPPSPPWAGIPLQRGLGHRVRQHVNPLQAQYQQPTPPPPWERVYRRLGQPFHLDIGTGSGRFLLRLAQEQPDWNFLGVEIRQALVERANAWRDELGLDNVHFLFANINVSLRHLFAPGDLSRVTILFPDPWFKKRHHKRRIVQPQLVADLALLLRPGSPVFLQSDIQEVAEEMAARFLEHPQFWDPHQGPLDSNPLGIPTEREWHCLQLGLPIYRYWLERR
jgi:tRNA (guanine-N7-)-methyltransferase